MTSARARVVGKGLAIGFFAVWAVLLSYYALHGAAMSFLRNYFLVARAVAFGYSNSWWPDGPAHPAAWAYYYTPVLILILGLMTICDLRSLRVRRDYTKAQSTFLAFLCVLAACYQTALYRSDATHLQNTMIALPFVLVLAIRDLPAWSVESWISRAVLRAVLAATFVLVYPLRPQLTDAMNWLIMPPIIRFVTPAPIAEPKVKIGLVPFQRATMALSEEPYTVGPNTVPMRKFLDDAASLRAIIGERATYVVGAAPYYTGLVYFMMDLKPAPFLFDRETMILNEPLYREHLEYLRAHIAQVACVITGSLEEPEARMFMDANPGVAVHTRRLGDAKVLVLVGPSN